MKRASSSPSSIDGSAENVGAKADAKAPAEKAAKKSGGKSAAKTTGKAPVSAEPVPVEEDVRTPPPERIAELRRAAGDYIARASGVRLAADDVSPESLAFVDHYVQQVSAGAPLRAEVRSLVAVALGVQLGEVLLARFGG